MKILRTLCEVYTNEYNEYEKLKHLQKYANNRNIGEKIKEQQTMLNFTREIIYDYITDYNCNNIE